MKYLTSSEFYELRNSRILSMTTNSHTDRDTFFASIYALGHRYSKIESFARKIEQLNFQHEGLSSAQYMSHCYRLGLFVITHFDKPEPDLIKLALCHNIIEVTGNLIDVQNLLEPRLYKAVEILTVDRKLQWDEHYKQGYYDKIKADKLAAIIKVFDKTDNLFTLSENTDFNVKAKYLSEIEYYLIPLADKFIPSLKATLTFLVSMNCKLLEAEHNMERQV